MSNTLLKEAPVAVGTTTMKAAVVQSFDKPLTIEQVTKPSAGRERSSSASRRPASATRTSTRPTATGP